MPSLEQFAEFASNHPLLSTGFAASILLLVFSELQRKSRGLTDVSPQDAVRLMNDDAAVIDLRSPERFQAGHLVNARNIPADQVDPDSDKLAALRDKPLIVVCDNGGASSRTAGALRKAGFERAFSLKGGVMGWSQENLPLVAGRKSGKKKQA